jgi:predicted ATP-binding protein involved in virulence
MILKSLTVEQYRGFASRTPIEFDPSFTLIVGENGVGKTSVLWALRVLLSHTLARLVKRPAKNLLFQPEDITRGWPYLRAEASVGLDHEGTTATCVSQKNAAEFVPSTDKDGRPREHAVDTPDKYEVSMVITVQPAKGQWRVANTPDKSEVSMGAAASSKKQGVVNAPLVVYYSAHRSLALERGASKVRAAGGPGAAYAEALEDRELRLGEAALLWRKEAVLEETDGRPARANRAVEQALPAFLGEFRNLRVEGSDKPRLVVDKRGTTLDLSQLSDGERGLLAVLIDLTLRLAQANPALEHPARDAQAVVLIDELDLHMHPRWQREIVSRLTTTFPNCQFVATTHSPQIISEIQPENLLLLRQEGDRIIPERCGQAYGLDVSYVLEHIMGTAPRAAPAIEAIHAVEHALEYGNLAVARERLDKLRTLLHGDDAVVVGLEATINNLEALGDAAYSEEE